MPNLVGIGKTQVPTNAMLGGLAYQDPTSVNIENLEIENVTAIKSLITETSCSAIFLYDTTKDSDGGVWRKRCQDRSWFDEGPSVDRGERKEFPALAIIVGESSGNVLHIYDGDHPNTPLWMSFRGGASHLWANITTVHAINGDIFVGLSEYGVVRISLLGDSIGRYRVAGNSSWGYKQPREILTRNTVQPTNNARYAPFSNSLICDNVSSVYAMALHDAPTDSCTGMKIPTLCVVSKNGSSGANSGGLTIFHDDGTVTSVNHGYGSSMVMGMCAEQEALIMGHNGPTSGQSIEIIDVRTQKRRLGPGHQVTAAIGPTHGENDGGTDIGRYYGYGGIEEPGPFKFNSWGTTQENPIIKQGSIIFGTGTKGLHRIAEEFSPDLNRTNSAGYDTVGSNSYGLQAGMVNITTKDINTGWMHGDTHVCLGMYADPTQDGVALSNGGQYSSFAYPTRNFTAYSNGALKYQAVAEGAELLSYTGFDANNYIRRNETFTIFGDTSCFVMMGWSKTSATNAYQYLMNVQSSTANHGMGIAIHVTSGLPYFWDSTNGSGGMIGDISVADGHWHHICCVADWGSSAVQKTMYVDGSMAKTSSKAVVDLNPVDNWNIGHYTPANTSPAVNYPHQGQLALLKISGGGDADRRGVPTAAQVKKIYEDELPLFQPNAKCTLYGSSNAITATDFDDDTNILHVGTSQGRSDFRGLKRINNTTNAITSGKTLSAAKGMVVEV